MPVNINNVKILLAKADQDLRALVKEQGITPGSVDFQGCPEMIWWIHRAWVSGDEGDFASMMAALKMAIGSRYEEEVAPLFKGYPQEFIDDVRSF